MSKNNPTYRFFHPFFVAGKRPGWSSYWQTSAIFSFVWLVFLVSLAEVVAEPLQIVITEGAEGAIPIAVVPFSWTGTGFPPENIADIVAQDLYRSGKFRPLPNPTMPAKPTEGSAVNFEQWRSLGVENLVIGRLYPVAGGIEVHYQLLDIFKGEQMHAYTLPGEKTILRRIAHNISDLVYRALTGQRGVFNTRIAYVLVEGFTANDRRYSLQVADADGHNPQIILKSPQPILSPAWSPDGQRIAYVSFEQATSSAIFVQNVVSGKREMVTSFPGINGAPSWAPDGRRLALTLSKNGNPDIFILELNSGRLTPLTQHYGIDTEPAWSPDGKTILFTSNRGGAPQIYAQPVSSTLAQRISFSGDYNARAVYSPNGRQVAMVQGQQGTFRITLLDLASGVVQVLSKGPLDETPSFSPNGEILLYSGQEGHRGVLSAVSVDGRTRQRLGIKNGDVREPAWSPFSNL